MRLIHLRRGLIWLTFTAVPPALGQVSAMFGNKLDETFDSRIYSPSDISSQLPICKRNESAWQRQALELKNPGVKDWPTALRKPNRAEEIAKSPRYGPAQGVTWVDIDGDGWCDVVVSTNSEPARQLNSPLIVSQASCLLFYDPKQKRYRPGSRGRYSGTCQYGEVGSVFTFYFNRVASRIEVVEHELVGGLLLYSSSGWKEAHGRAMERGADQARKRCKTDGDDACVTAAFMTQESDRAIQELDDSDEREAEIKRRLLTYRDELFLMHR